MTSHKHHNCLEHAPAHSSVHQSLDELEFERGIWSAGNNNGYNLDLI